MRDRIGTSPEGWRKRVIAAACADAALQGNFADLPGMRETMDCMLVRDYRGAPCLSLVIRQLYHQDVEERTGVDMETAVEYNDRHAARCRLAAEIRNAVAPVGLDCILLSKIENPRRAAS